MNLLALLPRVLKTVAKIAGVDVDPIINAITGDNLPPEKRVELETAIMNHELEIKKLDVAALTTLVDEAKAATMSEDKFVRRARPFGLYVAYLFTLMMAVGILFHIVEEGMWTLISGMMVPLYGNAVYYTHNRTKEKMSETN